MEAGFQSLVPAPWVSQKNLEMPTPGQEHMPDSYYIVLSEL